MAQEKNLVLDAPAPPCTNDYKAAYSDAVARLDDLTAETAARVAEAVDRHPKGVLAFSGGRASLICLDLIADHRDRVEAAWVNTRAMLEQMRDFVLAKGATELRSNQQERFTRMGLPSRIVPIFNTPLGRVMEERCDRVSVTSWASCCFDLRAKPLYDHCQAAGAALLISGQRAESQHSLLVNPPDTLECFYPLWNWTIGMSMPT